MTELDERGTRGLDDAPAHPSSDETDSISPTARRVLGIVAVVLQVTWLTGHVTAGVAWRGATSRATEVFGHSPTWGDWVYYLGTDPELERLTAPVDALLPWLLLSFPAVAVCWRWLPRRSLFVALWAVAWPLGTFLLRGYGTAFIS